MDLSSAGKAVSGSACGHGESKCKNRIEGEKVRAAYCGQLVCQCCAWARGRDGG